MRKLTIKRTKAIAACAIVVNIYIQDDLSNDVTVYGLPFRKLGSLKNGEESSFEIEHSKYIIFACVDDALAKGIKADYSSTADISCVVMDKAIIPAGNEDVVISGKNKLNPLKGNPFIFDK